MTSTRCGTNPTDRPIYRARLLAVLFERAGYGVKAACVKCGAPFVVERAGAHQDCLPYCPTCLPRKNGAQHSAQNCDCGRPTLIIVYLTVHPRGIPRGRLLPVPLCEICAIDELLAVLNRNFL